MMRLLVLVLLVGAFAGGYWVGRLPNAPDIVSWTRGAYEQVTSAARGDAPIEANAAAERIRSTEAIIDVGGKLYKVGHDPAGPGR